MKWWFTTGPSVQPEEEVMVFRDGEDIYDLTSFLSKHPGGASFLLDPSARRDDLKRTMDGRHRHGKMAHSLLDEYRTSPGALEDEKNELESRVDWSRGMVQQVCSLGGDYEKWLCFPVDRKLKLFDSPLLERLSNTAWYVVPIVWVPVILYNLCWAWQACTQNTAGAWIFPGFLAGVLFWTLFEYVLHRFLFHMAVPKSSPLLITLHFLLHGLHHKVPFDPGRLVFPPVPAAMLGSPIFVTIINVLPYWLGYSTVAGILTGYVMYDLCHYYLHHGDPMPRSLLHQLKRHHSQHHFLHHNQGFGITSNIWDVCFGTRMTTKH